MVTGPAGSGKTYLAVHAAAQALARKEVNQILVSRTMATVGAEIGHLPGTEVEKMAPYVAPMLEALNEFFGKYEVEKMIKAEIIKIVPVALLRGYTFKHSYVLIDEAQNMTAHELKTVLTRLGEGSKMAVMADVAQVDCTHRNFNSGLLDFMNRLLVYTQSVASEFIGVVTLTNDDVVRSAIVREILEIYDVEVC
jgi:phosphate starvation-inducible PhoH-like protein